MKKVNLDREWEFRRGFADSLGALAENEPVTVNLPHDGMIGTEVTPDAAAKYDSGYYSADMSNYTKYIMIPDEWQNEKIGLKFDGIMMHSTVEINGSRVLEHHYGYSPFEADITDYISYGEKNRITINTNSGIQPSSRWYSGCGIIRSVYLTHAPKVHLKSDGIFVYTKEVSDQNAFMEAQIDVVNDSSKNRLVKVFLQVKNPEGCVCKSLERTIQVNSCSEETARMAFSINNPVWWDIDTPKLYSIKACVTDLGVYATRLIPEKNGTTDEEEKNFGIRTVSVDSIRGLLINGKSVKLKGGCVHHDNGLLGAISLYASEERKVLKLKEIGFNAIRTAHNPPSEALVEACDKVGMYIFDEAFDAWGMAKRPGDFSTYFNYCWEKEIDAYVRRDRIHPSVIMWSTGNEIPERGGLSNGYTLASKLADAVRKLDSTRPISNGICSFWSGLDDNLAKNQDSTQNAQNNEALLSWDKLVEPFTNGLDVVGYNYMEDLYEKSHELFPDRVILGSENFPKEIGFRWPVVEKLPYVIGDFTWTAWDYIGEAGIGKSIFAEPDDPILKKGEWILMPPTTSPYPWRLANDADYDINGRMRPQGAYRSVVWGSDRTYLYSYHPKNYGLTELIGMWGFTDVAKCWNYAGYENKPIDVIAFTNGDEAALLINGREIERKAVSTERPLPNSVKFTATYEPGVVEVVSFKNGVEVSRDKIETSGAPDALVVKPEKLQIKADGHDLTYVVIEVVDSEGRIVSDASVKLTASFDGAGILAGFGTGNPITEENYTNNETVTYCGVATAIMRSGYEAGRIKLNVEADNLGLSSACEIEVLM